MSKEAKGDELFRAKNYQDAVQTYLKIKSDDPLIGMKVADCYLEMEYFKKALPVYRKCETMLVEKDAENEEYYHTMTNLYRN
jgi:hypothetical protein